MSENVVEDFEGSGTAIHGGGGQESSYAEQARIIMSLYPLGMVRKGREKIKK